MLRSSRLLTCLLVVMVLSCLYATPASATRPRETTPIFVDTDIGIDDAVAISWLLNNQKVQLVGFTSVYGNASVENTTRNLLTLLDVADRATIPVTIGAAQPLELPRYRAGVALHGLDGFWFTQEPKDISTLPTDASAALISAVEAHPNLIILALGPLTNIAHAVKRDPDVFTDVRIVAVSGGSTGNTTPVAEFNAYLDPHALEVVLASPAQLELVTIDAFDQPTVDPDKFVEDLAAKGGAVGELLAAILPPHFQAIASDGIAGEATLPDAAAAVYAVQPELGTGTSALVKVQKEGYGRGQTIIADTFSERISLIGDPEEISVLAESAFIPGFDLNGAIFQILQREPDNAIVVSDLRERSVVRQLKRGLFR
jgi:inosine-uridine nucleoside N-ribohydrolase